MPGRTRCSWRRRTRKQLPSTSAPGPTASRQDTSPAWALDCTTAATLASAAGQRDFVKNGDRWQVLATSTDGGLRVQHLGHGGRANLPAAYVERDIELGYAATAHRVQGATVDTAHVLVTDQTTRETLYVASSRARAGTKLYLATENLIDVEAERPQLDSTPPELVLQRALTRTTAESSATEIIRETQRIPVHHPSILPEQDEAIRLGL